MRDQDGSPGKERWQGRYDDVEETDLEKLREPSKHRSKERSKSSRREEKDHRSGDQARSKGSDAAKDRDKERDRRKEDRDDREKDITKERRRDKEYERDKYEDTGREKDKDRKDRIKERDRDETNKNSKREREKERAKDKNRSRDKERKTEKDREREKERERHKERDREWEHDKDRLRDLFEREKGKDRNREKDADQDNERSRERDKVSRKQRDEGHDKGKEERKDDILKLDIEDGQVSNTGKGSFHDDDDNRSLKYQQNADRKSTGLYPATLELEERISNYITQPSSFTRAWDRLYHYRRSYVEVYNLRHIQMQIEMARLMSPGKFSHDKLRPDCLLKMVSNYPLSIAGSGKDVRHFEFEPLSSIIDYEVGDVLEILPGQSPAAVDAFIQRCNLNPETYITVHARGTENHLHELKVPIKLKTFVELTMDVTSAFPRRYFFEVMSCFASAQHEKERLQYFASPEGRDDLYQYNQKERRTVLEVLEDFPSVQMPFEWLVQLVPSLKTRAFSISSSLSAHPNQVHLTVDVVSWMTPFKRKRTGLCSAWLAGLDPQKRVFIPAWFHKGSLPPPPPSLPLILIGPGTGCAPFRGFIEERALQSKSGRTAPVLFFFGCRNEDKDFLYRDFWLSHSETGGVLSKDAGGGFYVAFSRDQPTKIYVQHKMKEHSERVWSLLSNGAAVYVAGSSTKMPADVFSAFEVIVSKESEVSREVAARWLRALEKAGKYYVEAWS